MIYPVHDKVYTSTEFLSRINRQERLQSRNELTRETKPQLINHRACDKMKGNNNVTRMVITKARAMTFGLGGKLELLFIRNALFSLFNLLIFVQSYLDESVICTFIQSYKS